MGIIYEALEEKGWADPSQANLTDKELTDLLYINRSDQSLTRPEFLNLLSDKLFPRGNLNEAAEKKIQEDVVDKMSGWDKFRVGMGETIFGALPRIAEVGADAADFLGGLAGQTVGMESDPRFQNVAPGLRNIAEEGVALPGSDMPLGGTRQRELTSQVEGPAALAGRIAPLLVAAPSGGATLPGQLTSGAILGGLTGGGNPYSGAAAGLVGAGVGNVLARTGSRLAHGFKGKLPNRPIEGTDDMARSMRIVAGEGGLFKPGAANRKAFTQTVDELRQFSPFTGGLYKSIAKNNLEGINEAATRAVAPRVQSTILEPTTRRALKKAVGETFDEIADSLRNGVQISGALRRQIDDYLPLSIRKSLPAGGKLTGRQFMSARSEVGKAMSGSKNYTEMLQARNVLDQMDDVAERAGPAGFKTMYARARERYKTKLALDKKGVIDVDGNIDPVALNSSLEDYFGEQYTHLFPSALGETDVLFHWARSLNSTLNKFREMGIGMLPMTLAQIVRGSSDLGKLAGTLSFIPGSTIASRSMLATPASKASGILGGTAGQAGAKTLLGQ